MKRLYKILLFCCFFSTANYGQQDLVSFIQTSDDYYHYLLSDTSVKNLSFKITTAQYINYIAAFGDSSYYYPIKVYWVPGITPKRVLNALPTMADSLRRQTLSLAQSMDNFFMSLIYDNLYENILLSPVTGIPSNAEVVFSPDTVRISYRLEFANGNPPIHLKHKYTRAGQLFLSQKDQGMHRVLKQFDFREVLGKWICYGWQEQQFDGENVEQGIRVVMEYKKVDGRIVPMRMDMSYQVRDEKSETGVTSGNRIFFFKDFTYNENIQIVTEPADSSSSANQ